MVAFQAAFHVKKEIITFNQADTYGVFIAHQA